MPIWPHPSTAGYATVMMSDVYNRASYGKALSHAKGIGMTAEEQAQPETIEEARPTLSQTARRERLVELAGAIGDTAVVESDKVIVETGEQVALYFYVLPDGSFQMTRWMTANNPNGHPRWREAAELILQPGESIHTSALGGGFLIEIEREVATPEAAIALGKDESVAERVKQLAAEFPEAVALLDPEEVPDYLLPKQDVTER